MENGEHGEIPQDGAQVEQGPYSIEAAAELLGSKYHKDYKKYFESMCKQQGLETTAPLTVYVDSILADTLQWLEGFPGNLHSKSAYSKPKTALLNLLNDEGVIAALGADYCRKAAKEIEAAFKAHSNGIVEKRLAGSKKRVMQVITSSGADDDGDDPTSSTSSKADALALELEETRARLEGLKALVMRLADNGGLGGQQHVNSEVLGELLKRW